MESSEEQKFKKGRIMIFRHTKKETGGGQLIY